MMRLVAIKELKTPTKQVVKFASRRKFTASMCHVVR